MSDFTRTEEEPARDAPANLVTLPPRGKSGATNPSLMVKSHLKGAIDALGALVTERSKNVPFEAAAADDLQSIQAVEQEMELARTWLSLARKRLGDQVQALREKAAS